MDINKSSCCAGHADEGRFCGHATDQNGCIFTSVDPEQGMSSWAWQSARPTSRRTDRVRLNPTSTGRKAGERISVARLAAFLLAVLVASSLSTFGGGHAHAAKAAEVHVGARYPDVAAAKAHAHQGQGHARAVSCDDSVAGQGGQDACCMSASSCTVCVPVPSDGFGFFTQSAPPESAPLSPSLPRDPPTLPRPPKLSVIT